MHGGTKYFFDSYALIAMLSGNPNYKRLKLNEGLTTLMNVMEVQYALLRKDVEEKEIKRAVSDIMPSCVGFSEDDCYVAAKFRYVNGRKRLSYVDCLGYILAKKEGVEFVTGDKEFEGMNSVRFIK